MSLLKLPPPPSTDAPLSGERVAAGSGQRPDILYLTHRFPFPCDKGDRIRNFHILKFLSNHANVHLASLADEPVAAESVEALQRHCKNIATIPIEPRLRWVRAGLAFARGGCASSGLFESPALSRQIAVWCRGVPFRSVLVSSSGLVPYLGLAALRGVRAVVDLVDVDSQKWLDYARAGGPFSPKAWLHRVEGRRLRTLEQSLPGRVHAVTLVSQPEADLYHSFCPQGGAVTLPNGVDLDYFQPDLLESRLQAAPPRPVEPESCIFVGALDYRPNVDGISWFCTHVWPQVVRVRPAAKLYLVGRRPAPAVRQLAAMAGIELIGQVADVRPYVAKSAVVIAPLQMGRGIQNKVLEALAMGKAVIGSPESLEGISTDRSSCVLEADSPGEWLMGLSKLWDDDERRAALGAAGRFFVERHHEWQRCLEPLLELLIQDEMSSSSVIPAHV